jgi:hypothetical protein
MSDATKKGVGTIHCVRYRPVFVFVKYPSSCRMNFRSYFLSVPSMTSNPHCF